MPNLAVCRDASENRSQCSETTQTPRHHNPNTLFLTTRGRDRHLSERVSLWLSLRRTPECGLFAQRDGLRRVGGDGAWPPLGDGSVRGTRALSPTPNSTGTDRQSRCHRQTASRASGEVGGFLRPSYLIVSIRDILIMYASQGEVSAARRSVSCSCSPLRSA